MNSKLILFGAAIAAAVAPQAATATVVHTGSQLVADGVSPTGPFGALVEAVGTQAINYGVDYSYGNVEGIFNDPPYKLCGISAGGICDLLTAVDGRIVVLGTTAQALTNSISILAGNTSPQALTLSVFGIGGNLLGTTQGIGGNSGPYTITRGSADIAFFSIGGSDTFGVESVTLGDLVAARGAVPEPATWAMMIGGFALAGASMRRRKLAVSFA